jgi:hypothetical protein
MQAARFSQLIAIVLGICLFAGAGFAQSGNSTIVVLDSNGTPLDNATLLYQLEGTAPDLAQNLGNAVFSIGVQSEKATLYVQDQTFGSAAVDVTLPSIDGAVMMIFVDQNTHQAKVLPFDGLRDIIQVAAGGTPVVPPPGQGCQLPDQQPHGGAGYVAVVSDRTSPFIASDCFKPLSDGVLTHAAWWGAYVNIVFGLGTDCYPGPGDDFRITYYDDGGGCPGNAIASFDVSLRQKFLTGNLLMGFAQEVQYISDFHAPVPVTGGECYYIQISNNTVGNNDCFWLWSTAPDKDGTSCQTDFGGNPGIQDFDLAFCVNVQIEPNGCGNGGGPNNNFCDFCEPIAGEGTFNFDNSNASADGPQDDILCDAFATTAIDADLWYCWTSPCTALVTLTTCGLTSVDTKIAVYDGASCPPGDPIACNDDVCNFQSQLSWSASSGSTYLIRVGTFPGEAGGPGQFNISCGAPAAANDTCDNAEALAIGGSVTASTASATPDGVPTCGTALNTANGVWYEVVGNGNRLSANTCGAGTAYDTKLGVFCGSCGSLVCVTGNDDSCGLSSLVAWDTSNGQSYLILVTGFGTAQGTFELAVSDVGANQGSPIACGAPATAPIDINSNVPDLFVSVAPFDLYNLGAGLTPFDRLYNLDSVVTLSAPTDWNGRPLLGFLVDGRVLKSRDGVLTGTLRQARNVEAIYGHKTDDTGLIDAF